MESVRYKKSGKGLDKETEFMDKDVGIIINILENLVS